MDYEDKDTLMGLALAAHNRANEVGNTEAQSAVLKLIEFLEVL